MTKAQKLQKEAENRCKSCIHYIPFDKKKDFNICKAGLFLFTQDICLDYKKNMNASKFSCNKCFFYDAVTETCHCVYVRTLTDAFSKSGKCLYEKDFVLDRLEDQLKQYKEYVKKITNNLKELER